MRRTFFVYILTNQTNNVLYTGVTNNLERRTFEHILKINKRGFAERYNCNKLVFFEDTPSVSAAIEKEKQIKGMTRYRKIKLIESKNPNWDNLFGYQVDEILPGSRNK